MIVIYESDEVDMPVDHGKKFKGKGKQNEKNVPGSNILNNSLKQKFLTKEIKIKI